MGRRMLRGLEGGPRPSNGAPRAGGPKALYSSAGSMGVGFGVAAVCGVALPVGEVEGLLATEALFAAGAFGAMLEGFPEVGVVFEAGGTALLILMISFSSPLCKTTWVGLMSRTSHP